MKPTIIRTSCLALFRNKKILCVKTRGKEVFHFVGGGVEQGESDIECLIREVKEEIGCEVVEKSIKHLGDFTDTAHGRENTLVLIRLYEADVSGEPKPSTEVDSVEFIDTSVNPVYLTDVAKNQVFPWLQKNNYIN